MNKVEKGEFSDELLVNESRKKGDAPPTYCDVCFIAFGSQEKRIHFDGKAVHSDCAKKVKSI
jgi:hypothetical protein